jgi:glycerol-3-phosphate acyltransferase PlsY
LVAASALVAALVIVRHRTNISRLLAGTENKIGRKPASSSS